MQEEGFFKVEVQKEKEQWYVYAPSSLDLPVDNSVMFVTAPYIGRWRQLLSVSRCLVYWQEGCLVPEELYGRHSIISCKNPRLEYARFFKEHKIRNLPPDEKVIYGHGSFISKDCHMGKEVTVMPGAYIGAETCIGDHVYIGNGVCLNGRITIGNHVVIRENTVIGADGLAAERDTDGTLIPIPQFGGVCIEDDVYIGANATIARGAIDNTVIGRGSMIDNNCFVSHNVTIEENVLVVGESILFGSSTVGKNSCISGNAAIRDGIKVGENAVIGMGSVVTRDVDDHVVAVGNPAHALNGAKE